MNVSFFPVYTPVISKFCLSISLDISFNVSYRFGKQGEDLENKSFSKPFVEIKVVKSLVVVGNPFISEHKIVDLNYTMPLYVTVVAL